MNEEMIMPSSSGAKSHGLAKEENINRENEYKELKGSYRQKTRRNLRTQRKKTNDERSDESKNEENNARFDKGKTEKVKPEVCGIEMIVVQSGFFSRGFKKTAPKFL